jgi:protoporphyrinogen IX oxidase
MTGWLGAAYLWVVAFHVIFVIFWMAALFMLPRFLVYQCEAAPGSAEFTAWTERINRLRRIIMTPAMIVVWILGVLLSLNVGLLDGGAGLGWLHSKLLLVLAMSAYHGWLIGAARKIAAGERPLSGRALRLINEVPGLLAIPIVILVFVKPF